MLKGSVSTYGTVSSQMELNEAVRMYKKNKQAEELFVHIFPGVPEAPGMPCQGRDRSI